MSEQNKENQLDKPKVLLEKVREIESAKKEIERLDAKSSDKDNTAKILNEKRELSEPMSDAAAKKFMASRSRRT